MSCMHTVQQVHNAIALADSQPAKNPTGQNSSARMGDFIAHRALGFAIGKSLVGHQDALDAIFINALLPRKLHKTIDCKT